MNEAELAQKLGEAMRVKSYEIRAGTGLQPFKNLLEGKEAIISVSLSKGGELRFNEIEPPRREIIMPTEQDLPKTKRKERTY